MYFYCLSFSFWLCLSSCSCCCPLHLVLSPSLFGGQLCTWGADPLLLSATAPILLDVIKIWNSCVLARMCKGVVARAVNLTLLQIYYVTCDGTEDLKWHGLWWLPKWTHCTFAEKRIAHWVAKVKTKWWYKVCVNIGMSGIVVRLCLQYN